MAALFAGESQSALGLDRLFHAPGLRANFCVPTLTSRTTGAPFVGDNNILPGQCGLHEL